MFQNIKKLGLIFGVLFSCLAVAQNGQIGRYVGTLKHNALKREQLAKLDFVTSRSTANEIELKAVLTLHFGDFKSGEYVSYHFDKVIYNLLNGTLVFDQNDVDITVTAKQFASGEFVGELRSASLGNVGELKLKLNGTARPTWPLIESVAGEYEGECAGEGRGRLQLHTLRSTEDSSRIGNPFGAYAIKGQFGILNDSMCPTNPNKACQRLGIENASYNFYAGEMAIVGDVATLSCKLDEKGMNCDNGCRFERRSDETKSRIFTPPLALPQFSHRSPEPTAQPANLPIAGTYRGYVHHEFQNRYQPIQLNVVTYQALEEGVSRLKISAVANLYFGDIEQNEFLAYRFVVRDFPNPLAPMHFVLSRLENDVDAFLKITSLRDGVIKGEWYSLIFGRVGSFEARQPEAGVVTLAPTAQMLTSIGATYEASDFEMNLKVFQNRTPINTENPFFPLDVGGWFRFKIGGSKEAIQNGSYDFYTGKFGFRRLDSRWTIGQRIDNQLFSMRTVSNINGSIMQEYNRPGVLKLKKKP